MRTRKCGCQYSDSRDRTVRDGYQLSGAIQKECDMHRQERERTTYATREFTEKNEAVAYAKALEQMSWKPGCEADGFNLRRSAELLRRYASTLP